MNFSQLTVRELRNYCRDNSIEGYSAILKSGGKAALVEWLETLSQSTVQPPAKPEKRLPRNNRPNRPRPGQKQFRQAAAIATAIFGGLYLLAGAAVDAGYIARTELQPQIEQFLEDQFLATLSPETLRCAEKYARYIELQEISDAMSEIAELELLALSNYRNAHSIHDRDHWLNEVNSLSQEWDDLYTYTKVALCH